MGMPAAAFKTGIQVDGVIEADIDNVKAAYDGTNYPIGLGHRRIAVLTGKWNNYETLGRLEGYRRALEENHIPYEESLIFDGTGYQPGSPRISCSAGGRSAGCAYPGGVPAGTYSGQRNVPLYVMDQVKEVADLDTPLFVYCHSGARSREAVSMLERMGYSKAKNIGGITHTKERWSDNMKVVIVGGVAGGATAAARIRRLDEKAEIIVFERSGYVSYANCGLPYYIGGVIEAPQELTLQTPESFFERFRVDMRVHHEVTAIHPERKAVSVRNLTTGEEFEESYDKLLLSPGAKPTQPRLPGMGIKQLFTLRTVEDTFRIKTYIQEHQPKSAVLAGGGFIGLELAENLRKLGMEVTIVQRPKQLMNPFDADMAALLHNEVRRHGVKLALGHLVEGFEEKDGGVDVLLADAAPLHADMVVLAIGVTPDSHLAKEAGLELGVRGSILVNDHMETSVPDIYAVGDAVQVKHFVTGEDTLIALAGLPTSRGASQPTTSAGAIAGMLALRAAASFSL